MLRIASLVCLASSFSLAAFAGSTQTPVVGGTEVSPGTWPDVVAVLGQDGSLCSGTLIAADLVLTAAHCIDGHPAEVVLGSVDLVRPDGERRAVKWSRAYPSWLDQYDVGLIMLEHPVFAKPRAIVQDCPGDERFVDGAAVKVVGFGLTTPSGTGDNTRLHEATLPVVDASCTTDAACAAAIAPGGEFIAGGNGTDACFGDSGGPVYLDTPTGTGLIGVVSRGLSSWTEPCGGGGIYVRADKVVPWIEEVSGRKLDRLPCDLPADGEGPAAESAGCNAGGAGQSGLAACFVLLALSGLVLARRRAAARG
jgi:secreted trypsin-like serine protease